MNIKQTPALIHLCRPAAGIAVLGLTASLASAAVIDTFESGAFDSSWAMTTSASVVTGGVGAGGSNAAAMIAGGGAVGASGLTGYFNTAAEGSSMFSLSFDFLYAADTGVRQFALVIGGNSVRNVAESNSAGSFINIVYNGALDRFQVHNGANGAAFVDLPNLDYAFAPGAWHHMEIASDNFGSGAASTYTISINGVSSGPLSYYQFNPEDNLAGSFNFNSAYGSNPGYYIDNVVAVVPEPASLSLLAGSLLLRRRRR